LMVIVLEIWAFKIREMHTLIATRMFFFIFRKGHAGFLSSIWVSFDYHKDTILNRNYVQLNWFFREITELTLLLNNREAHSDRFVFIQSINWYPYFAGILNPTESLPKTNYSNLLNDSVRSHS
jgi:hypothetical protein